MPAGAGPGMQRGPSAPPAGAPGSTQPGQPPIMGMGRGHITPGAPGAGAHTLGMPARMGGMGRGRVMPGAAAGMAHAHIHGLAPSPHAVASGPVAVGASAAAIAGARKIATGNGSSTRVNDKEIVFIYKDDNDESMEEKRARLAKYRMQQKLPVPTQSISSISSQIRAIQARLNTA